MQSCYGHTEGTAGISGALLALHTLTQGACPPVVNLRNINPYVEAALSDWSAKGSTRICVPRQFAPQASHQVPALKQLQLSPQGRHNG